MALAKRVTRLRMRGVWRLAGAGRGVRRHEKLTPHIDSSG